MNTAKDRIKRLVDEIPENKAGAVIDFLLYLKGKDEQETFLTIGEEEEIWDAISNDERMSSEEVKRLLLEEE